MFLATPINTAQAACAFVEAGAFDTPSAALGVWGDGTYIYVADNASGIRAYTFDGSAFTEDGSFDTPSAAGSVWGDGTYIYIADLASGVRAYTFDGTTFTEEGSFDTPDWAYDVWGDGTYIYIADYASGVRAYSFNGTTFTEEGAFDTPSFALGVWGDGTYIYVADNASGIRAYSFDGSTFTEEGTLSILDLAHDVWGDGTYIYVAFGASGVRAYSFNGSTFTEEGAFDTPDEARGVWGDGTYIYIADYNSGIRAYSFDGTTFTEEDAFDTPDKARSVWGDGTYVYVADWSSGIRAYSGCSAPPPPPDITTGLVAHWKLDETSGTTAIDSAGSNDGTMTGGLDAGTNSVAGQIDTALNFDTIDYYISAPHDPSIAITGDVSASVWINASAFGGNDIGVVNFVLSGESLATNILYRLVLRSDGDISIGHEYGSGSNQIQEYNTNLQTGQWYHLAITRDTTLKEWKLYVDGTQFGTTYSYTTDAAGGTSATFRIGRNDNSGSSDQFLGTIDDVRIYNRALSATDIAALFTYDPSTPCNLAYEAVMLYNDDEGVLQYCNSTNWIDMGPKDVDANSAGTCLNPAGVAGEIDYNEDETTLQYCNGANWISMGTAR